MGGAGDEWLDFDFADAPAGEEAWEGCDLALARDAAAIACAGVGRLCEEDLLAEREAEREGGPGGGWDVLGVREGVAAGDEPLLRDARRGGWDE